MTELIQPLTMPDCDLRDFPFMPLDVVRLRDSDISAISNGDEFRCAVLLWCASWHQVPAASIPDDDVILAQLAGFGRVVKEWKKVREGSLRGWIKCSDGRLYHPVVAEKANDAWAGRLEYRRRKEAERIRKAAEREAKRLADEQKQSANNPQDKADLSAGQNKLSLECPPENALKGERGERQGKGTVDSGQWTVDSGQWTVKEKEKEQAAAHASDTGDMRPVAPLPPQEKPKLPHTPAVALTVELRKLGVSVTSTHPALLDWVQKGVTIDMANEAVAIARQRKPEGSISPNYLTPILSDIRNPQMPKGAPLQEAKPWWESVTGIQAKGKELGLVETEQIFAYYRDRVFSAAGHGEWSEKKSKTTSTQGFQSVASLANGVRKT